MTLKVDMQHWMCEYHQVFSNVYSSLTLVYLMARSNFVLYVFVWEDGKQWIFSETIVV